MKKSIVETLVGIVVLVVAGSFAFLAYKSSDLFAMSDSDYTIKADFEKIDGINIGSTVKVSGISVGKVVGTTLNNDSYHAVVRMQLKSDVKIPTDSSAEIVGLGFMGDKYIAIVPGAENQYLANGGTIDFTQSSVSLESLIGKFMFGSTTDKEKTSSTSDERPESNKGSISSPNINDEIDAVHVPG